MSITVPSTESFKEKAKIVRRFLAEKCGADISHGHSLELISQIFGFKDWNTASAGSKAVQESIPVFIKTVGDMKRVLAEFDDSAKREAWKTLVIEALLGVLKTIDVNDGTLHDRYSLVFDGDVGAKANFQLKLEDEKLFAPDGDEIQVGLSPEDLS